MPVPMAKTVGVEDDLVHRKAGLLGQQPAGAPADLDLAFDRVGLAFSSNAMTITAAPYRRPAAPGAGTVPRPL